MAIYMNQRNLLMYAYIKDDWTIALFDNMQVILFVFDAQTTMIIQLINLPANNISTQGLGKGSVGWGGGGYSIIMHYLVFSSLQRSLFCVDLHATRRLKKAA